MRDVLLCFCHFPVWCPGSGVIYLIVSISDLCLLTYFKYIFKTVQTDIIEAFNLTQYLDDLLNIDNPYFEQMEGQIHPIELQLNKGKFF